MQQLTEWLPDESLTRLKELRDTIPQAIIITRDNLHALFTITP